jgi:hypothetical protein
MRSQWCREHIDETAKECGLDDKIVSEVKTVAKFCASAPAFADCGTRPIYRLISHKDEDVRNRAISLAEKSLNGITPTGGKKRPKLTEPEVRKIIKKAEMEVRGELVEKIKAENHVVSPYQPAPGSIPQNNDPPILPLGQLPELSKDAPMSEVLKRDVLLLAMAKNENLHPASEDGLGNSFVKPNALKVGPVKFEREAAEDLLIQWVRGYLTNKDREAIGRIMSTGEFGKTYNEIFTGLIWYAVEQLGGV